MHNMAIFRKINLMIASLVRHPLARELIPKVLYKIFCSGCTILMIESLVRHPLGRFSGKQKNYVKKDKQGTWNRQTSKKPLKASRSSGDRYQKKRRWLRKIQFNDYAISAIEEESIRTIVEVIFYSLIE